MAISQRGRLKRKPSGGLYHPIRKKRLAELGRKPTLTLIGDKRKTITHEANIYNPKTKKHSKGIITNETGNPANVNYVRRNILTKGSIVDTSIGKARITSRPGQHGSI